LDDPAPSKPAQSNRALPVRSGITHHRTRSARAIARSCGASAQSDPARPAHRSRWVSHARSDSALVVRCDQARPVSRVLTGQRTRAVSGCRPCPSDGRPTRGARAGHWSGGRAQSLICRPCVGESVPGICEVFWARLSNIDSAFPLPSMQWHAWPGGSSSLDLTEAILAVAAPPAWTCGTERAVAEVLLGAAVGIAGRSLDRSAMDRVVKPPRQGR
jgi:hypothetical protein